MVCCIYVRFLEGVAIVAIIDRRNTNDGYRQYRSTSFTNDLYWKMDIGRHVVFHRYFEWSSVRVRVWSQFFAVGCCE